MSAIRKNITLPSNYREILERLKAQYGCASDSELIRFALQKLGKDQSRALDDQKDAEK